jgi:putative intracellular protease/amidase
MNKCILMVLTSHGTLGSTGSKTGFWLEEFVVPYYVFRDNGFDVVVASPSGGRPPIDPRSSGPDQDTEAVRRFHRDAALQEALNNTRPLSEIRFSDFDAVFFPGGHGPMWDLSNNPAVAELVSWFYDSGRPVGAVCHGPAALVQAKDRNGEPIIKGKQVTGFSDTEEKGVGLDTVVPFLLEDKLKALGGLYTRGPDWASFVVSDGKLVTGQNPVSSENAARVISHILSS